MKSVKVNGVELEYELSGSGEPVLLISPVIADGFRTWDEVCTGEYEQYCPEDR